jgi:hypothetical protein
MSACQHCDGSGIAPATELTIARMKHLTNTVSICVPCDGLGMADDAPSAPDDEDMVARPALGRTHPAGNRAE